MCPTGQEFSTGVTEIEIECMQSGQWSISHIPRCQGRIYKINYIAHTYTFLHFNTLEFFYLIKQIHTF